MRRGAAAQRCSTAGGALAAGLATRRPSGAGAGLQDAVGLLGSHVAAAILKLLEVLRVLQSRCQGGRAVVGVSAATDAQQRCSAGTAQRGAPWHQAASEEPTSGPAAGRQQAGRQAKGRTLTNSSARWARLLAYPALSAQQLTGSSTSVGTPLTASGTCGLNGEGPGDMGWRARLYCAAAAGRQHRLCWCTVDPLGSCEAVV